MPGPQTWRSVSILLAALLLAGCPESPVEPTIDDDDTTTDPPPPPPPPPPPSASVPHGTPALYLSTSTDASVFNEIIGEEIEGSRQNFIQYVPATGEAALIDSNLSVSYAQSRSTIKTFDDAIYIVNVSETGARLRRFDNDALLDSPPDRPVPTPQQFDSVEEDCMVVHGDDLIYKVAWRESFPGYSDGPVVRVPDFFSGGSTIEELVPGIGGNSPTPGGFVTAACQFHMDWADGVWYDVASQPVDDRLPLYSRDLSTGEPTEISAIGGYSALEGSYDDISNVGFDQSAAWFAAIHQGSQLIDVYSKPLPSGDWYHFVRLEITGFEGEWLHNLDVDDGYVTFVIDTPDGDDYVALLSPDGAAEAIAIGAAVNQLQIVYR